MTTPLPSPLATVTKARPLVGVVSVDLSQTGGHRSHVTSLIACLDHLGFRYQIVSLATSRADRNSFRFLRPTRLCRPTTTWESTGEFRYRHVGAWFADVAFFRLLPRAALTQSLAECDAVHVASGGPAWGLCVFTDRRPALLHAATHMSSERANELTGPLSRRVRRTTTTALVSVVERFVLRHAPMVAATTVGEQRWMEDNGARQSAHLPHAVDTTVFFPPAGERADEFVLAVGRWGDPRKAAHVVVGAYLAAANSTPLPPLLMIGPDPLPAAARQLVENRGAANNVEVRYATQSELPGLYRRAQMLIVASVQEGFGLPVIEAMASGCPVVATRCGGPTELLEDGGTGVLVEVGDVEGLSRAIVELSRSPTRRQAIGEAALEHVRVTYSVPVVASRLAAIYERIGVL